MYINLWSNYRGHSEKCGFFVFLFIKIWMWMVSDKTILKTFRIHKTIFKEKPLEIYFILFSLFTKTIHLLLLGFLENLTKVVLASHTQ